MSDGITATLIIPVEGLFSEVGPGLAARDAFTDFMAETGLCRWLFSEGGMYEWTVGFVHVTDKPAFERNAISYLTKLGVKARYTIAIRDTESPARRTP